MHNPDKANKIILNEWSDWFWHKTLFLWLPFLILSRIPRDIIKSRK